MIRLLKNLLVREPLPANVHFHLDEEGRQLWCDESMCHPTHRPAALPFPSLR
jgi:hypothetical protein